MPCTCNLALRSEITCLCLHKAIVPGGCTKFIQATDMVWNACFKRLMHSHYDMWLAIPQCHQYKKEEK